MTEDLRQLGENNDTEESQGSTITQDRETVTEDLRQLGENIDTEESQVRKVSLRRTGRQ